MRHQKAGRTLGRRSDHRRAMMSNLVASLILSERVRTTDAKAKELKRLADRTITWGTKLGDLLTRPEESLSEEERARVVHHMRMARRVCKHPEALAKLFREVAPRFLGRPGGYTRVLKVGQRQGDAAPVSLVELVVKGEKEAPAEKGAEGKGAKGAKAEKGAEGKGAKGAKAEKGAEGKGAKGAKAEKGTKAAKTSKASKRTKQET